MASEFQSVEEEIVVVEMIFGSPDKPRTSEKEGYKVPKRAMQSMYLVYHFPSQKPPEDVKKFFQAICEGV